MKLKLLLLLLALLILGGCAMWDGVKKDMQRLICPECKPVIVEKHIPPEPTPAATPVIPEIIKKKRS